MGVDRLSDVVTLFIWSRPGKELKETFFSCPAWLTGAGTVPGDTHHRPKTLPHKLAPFLSATEHSLQGLEKYLLTHLHPASSHTRLRTRKGASDPVCDMQLFQGCRPSCRSTW